MKNYSGLGWVDQIMNPLLELQRLFLAGKLLGIFSAGLFPLTSLKVAPHHVCWGNKLLGISVG